MSNFRIHFYDDVMGGDGAMLITAPCEAEAKNAFAESFDFPILDVTLEN